MITVLILLGIVVWLGCAVFTTGMTVAYFQKEFPLTANSHYRDDFSLGVFAGLALGPLSTILYFFTSGFAKHGLQFKRKQ